MQMFKKQFKHGWLAIKASADETTIAHVERRQEQRPRVHMVNTISDNIYQASMLKNLMQQQGLKKMRCSLLLGPQEYQLMQVEKPNVPKEEQKQAVRWKLKDMMDYAVESATVDVMEIPADANNQGRVHHVYAVASPNEVIASLSNRIIDSGMQLAAIDIPEMAQRNIASLLEQKDRGLALLSLSTSGGLLTFTAGGELYHARRIDYDGQYSPTAYERLALELQRSLDHFERQFPYVVINKLVVAPFADCIQFCEYLRSYLYVPVESFELKDIFEFDVQVKHDDFNQQAQILPVLGAALREETEE